MRLTVDFIWDSSLGDLKPLRLMLRKALDAGGCAPYWQEWKTGAANMPAHLKKHCRPVILVNGYAALQSFHSTDAETILLRNIEEYKNKKARNLAALKLLNVFNVILPVFILLFPKCPVCWAAYFNVLANIGINIPYLPQLQVVMIGISMLLCIYFWVKASRTGNYAGPSLVTIALVLLLANKYLLDNLTWMNYLSLGLSVMGTTMLIAGNEKLMRLRFR